MAPAEKGTTSLKKTAATVRSAPLTTKLRSSTQEDHQSETNTAMFSQILEALQATTSQMAALTDRIANLETQQPSVPAMTDTLNNILQRLDQLELENQTMRKSMASKSSAPAAVDPMDTNETSFPALNLGSSASKYATTPDPVVTSPEATVTPVAPPPPSIQSDTTSKPATYGRTRRNFTKLSENPGFTYLYLPTRARMPFKDMRKSLRDLSFNSGSIVDIHYPAKNVVALLIHNDYQSTATKILQQNDLVPITNFDPLNPDNLADPQFKDASHEERTTQLRTIVDNQIQRTIEFLRPPVKLAVARDFQRKGLITDTYLNDLINLHRSNQSSTKPGRDNFKPLDHNHDSEDLPMLSDDETHQQSTISTEDQSHPSDHDMLTTDTNTSAGEINPAMSQ